MANKKPNDVQVSEIPIKQIFVVENHRSKIEKTHLEELMQSIKQHGIKQAIGVSQDGKNHYTLIFGHRRLLACQKLGWETIPASVLQDIDPEKMMILNLTENIQRKDPSFAELGRGIEKLKKMGLNYAEISARLGIPEKKVKDIAGVYDSIPSSVRSKVSFMSKGTHVKGKIQPQVATRIAMIKREFGLTEKACEEMVKYVIDTEMSKEDIGNMVVLLKSGMTVDQAIEKLCDYHVYTLQIVAHRNTVSKIIHENGCPSYKNLFQKIIYGQIKGIPKPDFIKI